MDKSALLALVKYVLVAALSALGGYQAASPSTVPAVARCVDINVPLPAPTSFAPAADVTDTSK